MALGDGRHSSPTGRVEIGEASIAIVAASAHRADAFAVCRYAIERVKQIPPSGSTSISTGETSGSRARRPIRTMRRRGRRRGGAHAREGRLFARLREIVGSAEIERDVPAGATLAIVWDQLAADFPALAPYRGSIPRR